MARTDWDALLNVSNDLNEESRRLINYFVKDTTDKIFRRMDMMDIKSPALRASIHAVVYNNAGGNDALVRFYYLNFGRFLELGVGRYAGDYDLGGEGVKVRNTDIPELQARNYGPLDMEFKGKTDRGISVGSTGKDRHGRPVARERYHQAKPFLRNTVKQEAKRIAKRLAVQMAYYHTIYITRGLIMTTAMDEADQQWMRTMGYMERARAEMGAMHIHHLEDNIAFNTE